MRTGLAGLRGRLAVAERCGAGVGRVAGLQPLGQQDLDPGGTWSYRGEGYVSMTAAPEEGDLRLDLAGNIRLGVFGIRCYGRTTLTDGESAYVTLSWGAGSVPGSWEEAAAALNATVGYWRDWLSAAKVPDHPWRPYLERSALTLKGLSYAPNGAIMAAATTSLPETPGMQNDFNVMFGL